jgi:uncharacterized protein (DUF1330 family)
MESHGLYIITLKEKNNIQLLEDIKSKVLDSVKNLGGNLVENDNNITAAEAEINNVLFVNLPHDDYDKLLDNPYVETVAPLVVV